MSGVQLSQVVKRYDNAQVIHGIDLAIADGEFGVFVGPSGCGKSTLLRMIAGLEETTEGKIEIGGRDVTRAEPGDRGVAMVFQTYALYPHMTVRQNMGFGLKMNGYPRAEIARKVAEASKILKLDPFLDRKPASLSGGQRQRVSIGRAIVRGPEVFLFDEPLSNLDAELRVEMRVEIARLHREIGATMIYVTHDQVEAMTLADKIVVLNAGLIQQVGAPMALYEDPESRFVAGFIGSPSMNFLSAKGTPAGIEVPALGQVVPFALPAADHGKAVEIGLRPEHLHLDEARQDYRVDIVEVLGAVSYVHVITHSGEKLVVENRGAASVQPGQAIGVGIAEGAIFAFDAQTGGRIRQANG